MKYAKPLFGIVTVLGITLLTVFFATSSSIDIQMTVSKAMPAVWNYFMPSCLFGGLSLLMWIWKETPVA
jgi:lipopolysaccharide export LptBFGC system permease protein LptF